MLDLTIMFYNPLPNCRFPGRLYGVPKVASKINFFVWMAALGRVLTNYNLRKRRLIVIDWYVTYV